MLACVVSLLAWTGEDAAFRSATPASLLLPAPTLPALGRAARTGAAGAEDGDARFEAMGKALAAARTLRVRFEAELETPKDKVLVKGTMTLAQDNKARVAVDFKLQDKVVDLVMISDGKMVHVVNKGEKPRQKPAEPSQNRNYLAMVERAGFALVMFTVRVGKDKMEPDLTTLLKVSDINLKESGKKTIELAHTLGLADKGDFQVNLTIDAATNLPLRRRLAMGKDKLTIHESYVIDIDPKLDEKTFQLPPE